MQEKPIRQSPRETFPPQRPLPQVPSAAPLPPVEPSGPLHHPLGPPPANPLGVSPEPPRKPAAASDRAGATLTTDCPHCGKSLPYRLQDGGELEMCPHCDEALTLPPIDKLDFVIAELRGLRKEVDQRGRNIYNTLGLLLAAAVFWAIFGGACREYSAYQQREELRRSLRY